jgi:hypothetical protein
MQGNLTPPIFSEAVVADPVSAGLSPPVKTHPVGERRDSVAVAAESARIRDPLLLKELQAVRQGRLEDFPPRPDLTETHDLGEHERSVPLHQDQRIIDSGRLDSAHVQSPRDEHGLDLSLQQEQYQSRFREVQDSLLEARQEIERSQGDLQALRQRCAFLEQERDQWDRGVRDLNIQLQAAREQLALRSAELATARHRCEELEQQRLQNERETAALTQALQHELQEAREQLVQRSGELAAAQQRCEGLEQQRLQNERETAASTQALQHDLQEAREQLVQRSGELAATQQRCEGLEQQRLQSEREGAARMEELERQRAAATAAAEADQRTSLRDLETQRLQDELTALQLLLEELPDIYEHKFRQRLQPLREQCDWLLHENNWLRSEWPTTRPELQPALESEPVSLAPPALRRDLLETIRALMPFGRLGRQLQGSSEPEADRNVSSGAGDDQPAQELSGPPDDEPPRAASAAPRHR